MARPDVATRTPLSSTPRPTRRGGRDQVVLAGPLAWIPELLAIGGLVAAVALLVGALL